MKTSDALEAQEPATLRLTRRELLKLVGGGIVVFMYPVEVAEAQDKLPSAYLRVGEDGTITFLTGKIEMGQGVMTSLAQMAAEELDVPLQSMRAVMGDTSQCPLDSDGGTWGSLTTRNFGPLLRTAAARARSILIELASQQLGVPRDQLMTQSGYVISRVDNTVRLSYASLAGGKNIDVHLTTTPTTKNYSQFTISGKPASRLDAVEKVTGQAKYAADIRLPGMMYARILRPPARNATLTSVDTTAAEKIAGVQVVRVGALIAVLHEQPEIAETALGQITAQYNVPQTGTEDATVHEYLLSRPPAAQTVGQGGNLTAGEGLAKVKLEQTYYTPYVAHAPIEPHAAVASIEGTTATIWASTQTPFTVRTEVASALGLSTANVRVITPYVGGGFGGKSSNAQAVEAARIAKAAGKPVNLAWTREEEFSYDVYQCPAIIKIRAGLDQNNKISFWDYQVYYVADRGTTVFYNIPNYRTRMYGGYTDSRLPFTGGPWRAPGNNANTFARESHIDGLAAAAGWDPLDFRRRHLTNTRMRKVLDSAVNGFGWPSARFPSGRGFGVACGEDAGAYVAMMAEVEVDQKTGDVKVKRLVCAQDLGRVINPEGARQQMEGSMMMGLGYALSEELHFQYGRILDLNFHQYSLPHFTQMPQLETVLVENNTLSPQGGGEPPIITVGATLANAVFDATGVRLNRLPMTPERVLAALQQAPPPPLNPPERSGDQIRLSWVGRPGIRLQRSATLSHPVWLEVPNTDGGSSITLPVTGDAGYFRLVKG